MPRAVATCVLFLGIVPRAMADSRSQEKLIQQLADRNFKVRQAAARAIQALGPEGLPALRKAKDHPDPEVRRRIAKWIPEFELAAAVAPKKVTLNLVNQPMSLAIEELARQTGYRVEFDRQDRRMQKPCTVQVNKVTFWEALDKVCQQAGLVPSPERPQANALSLVFSEEVTPHVAYHRSFRIAATGFMYHRNYSVRREVRFGKPRRIRANGTRPNEEELASSESLQLDLNIQAEPRLAVAAIGQPVLTKAVDDQNHSLIERKQDEARLMTEDPLMRFGMRRLRREFALEMHAGPISLLPPAKGAHTVRWIRGFIPIYLEKDEKTIVLFADIWKARGKKTKREGIAFQVDLFFKHPTQERYKLFMTVLSQGRGGVNHESKLGGDLEIQDAKGNAYPLLGYSGGCDNQVIELQLSFGPLSNNAAPLGPPVKLVYIKTRELVYHVPFEFKDLPLP